MPSLTPGKSWLGKKALLAFAGAATATGLVVAAANMGEDESTPDIPLIITQEVTPKPAPAIPTEAFNAAATLPEMKADAYIRKFVGPAIEDYLSVLPESQRADVKIMLDSRKEELRKIVLQYENIQVTPEAFRKALVGKRETASNLAAFDAAMQKYAELATRDPEGATRDAYTDMRKKTNEFAHTDPGNTVLRDMIFENISGLDIRHTTDDFAKGLPPAGVLGLKVPNYQQNYPTAADQPVSKQIERTLPQVPKL